MSAAARRNQLLDVAARLVGERGFHAVSVDSVARSAGVTRATVYKHFADRNELLAALIGREAATAFADVARTTVTDLSRGEPVALMHGALSAYLHAVAGNPSTWCLILMPPEGSPAELHAIIEKGRSTALARFAEAVRAALGSAGEGAGDPELTATLLSTLADEYARLVLTDPRRFPPERLLEHARWMLERVWPRGPTPPAREA